MKQYKLKCNIKNICVDESQSSPGSTIVRQVCKYKFYNYDIGKATWEKLSKSRWSLLSKTDDKFLLTECIRNEVKR